MKRRPKAAVLYGDGINCHNETVHGLALAGFDAELLHTTDLMANSARLSSVQLLAMPGGFSFADEIASGKVLALKLKDKLKNTFYDFVDKGNLVIGICNGFQILVQMGLLPDSNPTAARAVSLCHNSHGRFMNKWVELEVDKKNQSGFFLGLQSIHLPVRHGEGRLVLSPELTSTAVETVKKQSPLRYRQDINGSYDRIAGLLNQKGNVLGLMPHPEAFVRWEQHPAGHKVNRGEEPHGLSILKNAAAMVNQG
ncbi:MAG: phosphoribosylformylglycinamidine synthase subunit PurQ [Candidatus Obscuribacterales bacterium]|nr:phosphoribosylformylglycinamidine synthase subunit PurQ [Candidatus Obscuribacterales bacterium]